MIATYEPPSWSAPPDRYPTPEILRQARLLRSQPLLGLLGELLPNALAVLNASRQIVYANPIFLELAGKPCLDAVLGLPLGEALNCAQAGSEAGSCGPAESCRTCGIGQVGRTGHWGEPVPTECQVVRTEGRPALDLRISGGPLPVGGEIFTVLALHSTAEEKRRKALERTFFHDVLNTAGCIYSLAQLMQDNPAGADSAFKVEMLSDLSGRLVEEIQAQRALTQGEDGRLSVNPQNFTMEDLLEEITRSSVFEPGESRRLLIDAGEGTVMLLSDRTLLRRVLLNLVKNAMEATGPEESITLGGRRGADDTIEFWVHNPGEMPREARQHLFQRHFTTKGQGRGLGTYSVKLLVEQYLGGSVLFESSQTEGTTFRICLPVQIPLRDAKPKLRAGRALTHPDLLTAFAV